MPIQSQGIITRDNVSADVSAVAYFRVVDAEKSVVAIEDVQSVDKNTIVVFPAPLMSTIAELSAPPQRRWTNSTARPC